MAKRTGRMLVLAGGMLLSPWLTAAENMSFHGTLVEYQPCVINDGETLDVDFSEIFIEQVDGVNYEKTLQLNFSCDTPKIPPLSLRHLGNATAFDPAAVQSDIADFGIHVDLIVLAGNGGIVPFTVGQSQVITNEEVGAGLTISMLATPTKRSGATLQAGAFTATSTLQIEYQ